MSINDNNVTKERHRWTKAGKQYIKGIVHNYSLQRWTDQDIVDYLQNEKKIKIGRSTVTTIRNQVEEAGNWYLELRECGTKTIAFFKERLDSLLSYQKKLNEILATCEVPEIRIRAIAELRRIEMSLPYFKNFHMINFKFDLKSNENQNTAIVCLRVPSHIQSVVTVKRSGVPSPSSPIEEQEPEEEEETEADRYWRTHPTRVKPTNTNTNTNKVKFVIE